MNLVWHIAKKDIRQMALPVLPWIAFIVAAAIWFRSASPSVGIEPGPDVVGWLAFMGIWPRLLVVGQFVIGYLLVGALVIEDPLVGANSFWMTRPIANARLLAGKLVAVASLFILVPTGALSLVWLTCGFTLNEVWLSSGEFALGQSLFALPALAVASLARNLAHFLFCSVTLLLGVFASGLLVGFTVGLNFEIPLSVPLTVAGLALVHQFLTRRTMRTWLWISIALPVGIAIWRQGRPDGVAAPNLKALSEPPAYPEVKMTVERISLRIHPAGGGLSMPVQSGLTLAMSPPTRSDGLFYTPAGGMSELSWPKGPSIRLPYQRVSGWGNAAALHLVRGTSEQTMGWYLYGIADRTVNPLPDDAQVTGWMEVWLTKPRVLGELPLELGAGFSNGASRTQVIALESSPGWDCTLVIEERDARPAEVLGMQFYNAKPFTKSESWPDVFVLVNRAANRSEIVAYNELGAVVMQGQATGFRRLLVQASSSGNEWRREAVIVKVRLEPEGRFWRTFETHAPVVLTSGR